MSRSLLKRLKWMAPDIDWTAPIPVSMMHVERDGDEESAHSRKGFLCRICVAEKGYAPAKDFARLFSTEEACLEHIGAEHVAK